MKSRREPDVIIIENDSEVQSSTISNSNSWVYTENASLNIDERFDRRRRNVRWQDHWSCTKHTKCSISRINGFQPIVWGQSDISFAPMSKDMVQTFLRAIHIVGTGCLLDFILLSFLSFLTRIGSVHIIFIFFKENERLLFENSQKGFFCTFRSSDSCFYCWNVYWLKWFVHGDFSILITGLVTVIVCFIKFRVCSCLAIVYIVFIVNLTVTFLFSVSCFICFTAILTMTDGNSFVFVASGCLFVSFSLWCSLHTFSSKLSVVVPLPCFRSWSYNELKRPASRYLRSRWRTLSMYYRFSRRKQSLWL